MKSASFTAAIVLLTAMLASSPAPAAGCLKGAVVGGIAVHYAGHHGLLGAGAGCLIGKHYASKQARQEINNRNSGYGSSRYNVGQYR